jgi:tetratricopeptide (TPR) repeat protein
MITVCFPHVDEETRNILQSAMDEAKDMIDFAEILSDKVCTESDNPLITYFAYYYGNLAGGLVEKLQKAGKFSALAGPILLDPNIPREMIPDWNESQRTMSEALEAAPNDWIACHIYINWRFQAEGIFAECSTNLGVMRVLEQKIVDDDEYSYFLPQLNLIKSRRLAKERRMDEAVQMYDKVILEAMKQDNPEVHLSALNGKANLVKRTDIPEALAILEKHREMCLEFGWKGHLSNYHQQLGHIAMARGEFNLALQHQLKSFEIETQSGFPMKNKEPYLAILYNMMGDGAKALETLMMHQGDYYPDDPRNFIQKAWALTNVGIISEAESAISKASTIVLKSNDEVLLGLVYLVEGLIEKTKLAFDNAKFTLEQALDIFERYLSNAFINITLIHLCDLEIETFGSNSKNIELSGPWMARLFYHVEKKDLPGIEAQAKLLRAKFLKKQERIDESNKLVSEVSKISKSQNMEYLDDVAKVLIPKVRK